MWLVILLGTYLSITSYPCNIMSYVLRMGNQFYIIHNIHRVKGHFLYHGQVKKVSSPFKGAFEIYFQRTHFNFYMTCRISYKYSYLFFMIHTE